MAGIVLIVLAVVVFLGYFWRRPEAEPQEKITSTGVVEQVIGGKGGSVQYVVRFTGERNRSFLGRTVPYTGSVSKYEDGKLAHIRYWFGKKGTPGVEILDEELTKAAEKSPRAFRWCLVLSPVLLALGILLLMI